MPAHVDAAAEHERIGGERLLGLRLGRLHQLDVGARLARALGEGLGHAPGAPGVGGDDDEDPHLTHTSCRRTDQMKLSYQKCMSEITRAAESIQRSPLNIEAS